jgi:hypothetical protein
MRRYTIIRPIVVIKDAIEMARACCPLYTFVSLVDVFITISFLVKPWMQYLTKCWTVKKSKTVKSIIFIVFIVF